MAKLYSIIKTYECPTGRIGVGVTKTENEWMEVFPNLEKGDCEIKDDWFKHTEMTAKEFYKHLYGEDAPKNFSNSNSLYIFGFAEAYAEHLGLKRCSTPDASKLKFSCVTCAHYEPENLAVCCVCFFRNKHQLAT